MVVIPPPFDWSRYNGNLTWLPRRTIFLTRHGSHAYGTNIATSDEDFRGIAIAPARYYTGFFENFEQAQNGAGDDLTIFDVRKFFKLASQGNPSMLEILYTDNSDHVQKTWQGLKLLENRELFLSKRVKHTFSGYSHAQIGRIKRHYHWHKNPPKAPPTRSEFGLQEEVQIPRNQLQAAESMIKTKLDSWSVDFLDDLPRDVREAILQKMSSHLAELGIATGEDLWIGAARLLGFSTNFIEVCDKERKYLTKVREWKQYQDWLRDRNPDRAELEAKFGYDTKHALHCVRLFRMCREMLTAGAVIVKRPDAEELLAIRAGAWTFEQLIDWAASEDAALEELAKKSRLPNTPDYQQLDQLCSELINETINTPDR